MAERSGEYVYIPIADAKKMVNMRASIFARVFEFDPPKKSRGTDYALLMRIVDQSCPPPGLKVHFFAGKTEGLPNVKFAGDIISLHHVEMKVFNGEVCCVFNKRISSFALFDGKINMDINPYQTSPMYSAVHQDSKSLIQLRASLPEHQSQTNTGSIKRLRLLRHIKTGKTFDIVCKILHLCETSENVWMIFVWDGTDSPPNDFQTNLDMELEKPIPLHLEPLPLPRETICLFPREGTVLRIIADECFEDIHLLQSGESWVKLCNVTFELHSGMWRGVADSSSKLVMLSDEDDNVIYRKRIYDDRCALLRRQPSASFPEPSHITETNHDNVAYATLMDSLTCSKVVHKFKCVVRVVASCPWRGEDLHNLDGNYRIRLTLEDPTARIHAYISNEEGEKFFGGHPAAGELTKKMCKVLGVKYSNTKKEDMLWTVRGVSSPYCLPHRLELLDLPANQAQIYRRPKGNKHKLIMYMEIARREDLMRMNFPPDMRIFFFSGVGLYNTFISLVIYSK